MENHSSIYERKFLQEGFNDVKYFRDQWLYSRESYSSQRTELCDVFGPDTEQYSFILQQVKKHTQRLIEDIVLALIGEYKLDIRPIRMGMRSQDDDYFLAILYKDTMFLFRESGVSNTPSPALLQEAKRKYRYKELKTILLVEGKAYIEDLSHNDDDTDPSHGTNIYSLEYLFTELFGNNEYQLFKNYYHQYIDKVRKYYGIAVVKTLQPNSLFSYRQDLHNDIISYDFSKHYKKYSRNHSISVDQRAILDKQFIDDGFARALTSNQPFAACFLTAEWLFQSFKTAPGSVDYTSISMGYFKAMEQFLYDFLGCHTKEKDQVDRVMTLFKGDPGSSFTDTFHKANKNKLTLGPMTIFVVNNMSLLRPEIDKGTMEFISDVFLQVTDQRNGYFHKDNIDIWTKVENDRSLTFMFFYLLLGAYPYTDEQKRRYGVIEPKKTDEAEKLFAYMHMRSFNDNPHEFPIVYLGDEIDQTDYYYLCSDDCIEYDRYGRPKYSGMRLKRPDEEIPRKFDRQNIPELIREGRMLFGRGSPISISITGPEKEIWKNGRFIV